MKEKSYEESWKGRDVFKEFISFVFKDLQN